MLSLDTMTLPKNPESRLMDETQQGLPRKAPTRHAATDRSSIQFEHAVSSSLYTVLAAKSASRTPKIASPQTTLLNHYFIMAQLHTPLGQIAGNRQKGIKLICCQCIEIIGALKINDLVILVIKTLNYL